MGENKIKNVAIIAHVDHGKTTLVDVLFKQSGMFRDNQRVDERLMDSLDQERERGITISAKNGSFQYRGFTINVIDTPGHADFGGQVERVLRMADAAILLVDAAEGPMPQTYFVLKKALALHLPILVVINKVDKPMARVDWVHDQVFDLFVKLDAPDDILDFPIVYASAKEGYALKSMNDEPQDMQPLLDKLIEFVPAPKGDAEAPAQLLVSSLDYSSFLGRLAIGKITSGSLKVNQDVLVARGTAVDTYKTKIAKIYKFSVNSKVEAPTAMVGDIVAVACGDNILVGETITDLVNPLPLPMFEIDPPTISMNFIPNTSPFAGQEGQFVTSRHIRERLMKETLSDVALKVEEMTDGNGYKVSGRGELHLSVLIESMRREGYELQVTRPQVIFRNIDGQKCEPYEELTIDVEEESMGAVIEALGKRKGLMTDMVHSDGGMVKLVYKMPTRGLLGFRSEFMTLTKGMGVLNYIFAEYGPYVGEMRNRASGVLISTELCPTVAYALANLQERGVLFMGAGVNVYPGQIIGECAREQDMKVNPAKGKKLTNVRASGSDDAVVLTPHRVMSLEDCIDFINDDELVEITPEAIRLRKSRS